MKKLVTLGIILFTVLFIIGCGKTVGIQPPAEPSPPESSSGDLAGQAGECVKELNDWSPALGPANDVFSPSETILSVEAAETSPLATQVPVTVRIDPRHTGEVLIVTHNNQKYVTDLKEGTAFYHKVGYYWNKCGWQPVELFASGIDVPGWEAWNTVPANVEIQVDKAGFGDGRSGLWLIAYRCKLRGSAWDCGARELNDASNGVTRFIGAQWSIPEALVGLQAPQAPTAPSEGGAATSGTGGSSDTSSGTSTDSGTTDSTSTGSSGTTTTTFANFVTCRVPLRDINGNLMANAPTVDTAGQKCAELNVFGKLKTGSTTAHEPYAESPALSASNFQGTASTDTRGSAVILSTGVYEGDEHLECRLGCTDARKAIVKCKDVINQWTDPYKVAITGSSC